ncbi:MAG: hypothetical protein BVN35_13960 [Proteobacteria bacterium ST_bin11]|nr:MAG: hypothetical protein BVN35_13960 [Proteobacteria bacterium ST_bin11]
MLGLPESSLGAVIAATIAGVVSLLSLIVSKEQKVSDFRQAWIDALRLELSTVITHAMSLQGLSTTEVKDSSDAWIKSHGDFIEINKAITAIRLRLNPEEPECKAILLQLSELEVTFRTFPISNQKICDIEAAIIKHSITLLKNEWVRVKKGERVYKIARLIATFIVVIGSALVFVGYARNPF